MHEYARLSLFHLFFVLAVGVLPPDIMAFELAQERKGNQGWLAWNGEQNHVGFVGGSATFAVVAIAACRNNIFPRCAAAT